MPLVAFPWGSPSTRRVRCSAAARLAARLTAGVVFPTPPFLFANAVTRAHDSVACGGLGGVWGGGAPPRLRKPPRVPPGIRHSLRQRDATPRIGLRRRELKARDLIRALGESRINQLPDVVDPAHLGSHGIRDGVSYDLRRGAGRARGR